MVEFIVWDLFDDIKWDWILNSKNMECSKKIFEYVNFKMIIFLVMES